MSHSRLDGDLTAKSERCWPMSVVGSSRVRRNAISGRRALAQIRRQRDSRVGCLRHRDRVESPMCPPVHPYLRGGRLIRQLPVRTLAIPLLYVHLPGCQGVRRPIVKIGCRGSRELVRLRSPGNSSFCEETRIRHWSALRLFTSM